MYIFFILVNIYEVNIIESHFLKRCSSDGICIISKNDFLKQFNREYYTIIVKFFQSSIFKY